FYYSNYFLIFMMVMLSLFAGSDLISGDMRFKSLSLYLSRPISLLDYMKGKYSIVLFYILMFTLVPGVSLVIFKMLLTGSFSIPLKIIVAAIVSPIVLSLFLSSFIFMFSSLTSNGKLVKLTFFIVYIVSNFFAALFSEIFKNDYFRYLSIDMNISHFNSYLFGKEPVFDAPPVISGIVLLALTALCFAIVHWKLKRTEV
ncbi:MAG: hypothetical protein GY765_34125, partial [bacterium]|nr:hypothetical protein [bacterium]